VIRLAACLECREACTGTCRRHRQYRQGDRVQTPNGPGSVAYQRMEPPDYSAVAAVSVVLDSERTRAGYTGTIFPASAIDLEAF
jgi:hypothetical protein